MYLFHQGLITEFPFSLLYQASINSLQLVRMTAATKNFDQIAPILIYLHWLPIHARAVFKVLRLTDKTMHGLAPSYVLDLILTNPPSRHLRLAGSVYLSIPTYHKKSADFKSFSHRGCYLWKQSSCRY